MGRRRDVDAEEPARAVGDAAITSARAPRKTSGPSPRPERPRRPEWQESPCEVRPLDTWHGARAALIACPREKIGGAPGKRDEILGHGPCGGPPLRVAQSGARGAPLHRGARLSWFLRRRNPGGCVCQAAPGRPHLPRVTILRSVAKVTRSTRAKSQRTKRSRRSRLTWRSCTPSSVTLPARCSSHLRRLLDSSLGLDWPARETPRCRQQCTKRTNAVTTVPGPLRPCALILLPRRHPRGLSLVATAPRRRSSSCVPWRWTGEADASWGLSPGRTRPSATLWPLLLSLAALAFPRRSSS